MTFVCQQTVGIRLFDINGKVTEYTYDIVGERLKEHLVITGSSIFQSNKACNKPFFIFMVISDPARSYRPIIEKDWIPDWEQCPLELIKNCSVEFL